MSSGKADIVVVAGARPNFMKVAPVLRAMRGHPRLQAHFVHTGQHYDAALSDEIMSDLELPSPDHHLGVGKGAATEQTARILLAIDRVFEQVRPRGLVVVGDVTSTLAATLAAANREIPVAHVEAGLRSFDWSMPEERNRVVVDRLSRWLFVTEPSAIANLGREAARGDVHLVGNVMIDSLLSILPRAKKKCVREELELPERYAVLTMHRPGNVDAEVSLARLLEAIAPVAAQAPIVFPVHPRTRPRLEGMNLPAGLRLIDPLGYLDFVGLAADSSLVLTDSGGIQEETTVLGVPCITLRPNTERPITLEIGTNELVHEDGARVAELGLRALRGEWKQARVPEKWDGQAGRRIVEVLARDLG